MQFSVLFCFLLLLNNMVAGLAYHDLLAIHIIILGDERENIGKKGNSNDIRGEEWSKMCWLSLLSVYNA